MALESTRLPGAGKAIQRLSGGPPQPVGAVIGQRRAAVGGVSRSGKMTEKHRVKAIGLATMSSLHMFAHSAKLFRDFRSAPRSRESGLAGERELRGICHLMNRKALG